MRTFACEAMVSPMAEEDVVVDEDNEKEEVQRGRTDAVMRVNKFQSPSMPSKNGITHHEVVASIAFRERDMKKPIVTRSPSLC